MKTGTPAHLRHRVADRLGLSSDQAGSFVRHDNSLGTEEGSSFEIGIDINIGQCLQDCFQPGQHRSQGKVLPPTIELHLIWQHDQFFRYMWRYAKSEWPGPAELLSLELAEEEIEATVLEPQSEFPVL
jgi:hypothetical protein